MQKIVAYIRVSTRKQERSGLGLEAQQEAVEQFRRQQDAVIIREYREVETGKSAARPELAKAIAEAKRARATLVIAKLDRLARNVAFVSALMEAGCEFVCCDMPFANKLTIHILAAVAEAEAEAISKRTKAALAAAKRRGTLLGSSRPGHWEGREHLRKAGQKKGAKAAAKVNRSAARAAYADILPAMLELRAEGRSLRAIASALNDQGYETRRGRPWNKEQVRLVLQRAEATAQPARATAD